MKQLFLPALLMMTTTLIAQNNHSFTVHFNLDKFNITPQAASSLDSFLASNKNTKKIKLYGHTDSIAGNRYNDALSLKRTNAVKNYLLQKGFDANNIMEEKGFGKRSPLNNNEGTWEMHLNRRVEIVIEENKTIATKTSVDEKENRTLTQQLEDTNTLPGNNIVLKNMNFYGGTHIILPESMPILTELLQAMMHNPQLKIVVEGHICCQEGNGDGFDLGTKTMNLSENRAREICSYLSKNGVAAARLQYKGFGHSMPLYPYPEKTEQERVLNRRVEIKILNK